MNPKTHYNQSKQHFYLLLLFSVCAIFFTHPFLVYPFDVFTHLQWIDQLYDKESLPIPRRTWHYMWSNIFHLIGIPREEIFLRAYIIHFTQLLISFFILIYFSKVIFRNLFYNIDELHANYIAYWATLIWFTLYSTHSGPYHQAWILWYSVNYQITLLLSLLITALSLSVVLESKPIPLKALYIVFIIILSAFILRVHAMEFVYYLLYMGVLILVFSDKLITLWKRNLFYSIPLTILALFIVIRFLYFLNTLTYKTSSILNYLTPSKLPELFSEILTKGELLVTHFNRAHTTLNELIYLSLSFLVVSFVIILYRYLKHKDISINLRLTIFLLITSLFIIIPLNAFTGGLAAMITYTRVAYRFYFSSLLFLILPAFIYYLYHIKIIKKFYIVNLMIFVLLLGTVIYSKHCSQTHNYYNNVRSIANMFKNEKMAFNLSSEEIAIIGEKLKYYESTDISEKPNYYYARDDIAFVLKFIYRKPVQYFKRGSKDYKKSFVNHTDERYIPILFDVPENFPNYRRFH